MSVVRHNSGAVAIASYDSLICDFIHRCMRCVNGWVLECYLCMCKVITVSESIQKRKPGSGTGKQGRGVEKKTKKVIPKICCERDFNYMR